MKLTGLVAMAVLGTASTAIADGRPDCPPSRPSTTTPCTCKGQKGDPGPRGPQGNPGKDGQAGRDGKDGADGLYVTLVETRFVRARPAIGIELGVTGFAADPHGDWAWGPALSLSTEVHEKYDLRLNLGLAMGASDGRETGTMVSLVGERRMPDRVGIFLGAYRAAIYGSVSNGGIDGTYLGLTGGASYTSNRFRFELGPVLTGLRDDFESGTQLAVGVQGSLFVRLGK